MTNYIRHGVVYRRTRSRFATVNAPGDIITVAVSVPFNSRDQPVTVTSSGPKFLPVTVSHAKAEYIGGLLGLGYFATNVVGATGIPLIASSTGVRSTAAVVVVLTVAGLFAMSFT